MTTFISALLNGASKRETKTPVLSAAEEIEFAKMNEIRADISRLKRGDSVSTLFARIEQLHDIEDRMIMKEAYGEHMRRLTEADKAPAKLMTPFEKSEAMLTTMTGSLSKRRDVLKAQIERDTAELYEVNVSLEAFTGAAMHISNCRPQYDVSDDWRELEYQSDNFNTPEIWYSFGSESAYHAFKANGTPIRRKKQPAEVEPSDDEFEAAAVDAMSAALAGEPKGE